MMRDMSKELLTEAATALLGTLWQSPLARMLDVDGRLVRRWAAGERPVPTWVLRSLAGELKKRQDEIRKIRRKLSEEGRE